MQSKPSGTWAVVQVTPADPSGAIPRDDALSMENRRCRRSTLPGGKSVYTGKGEEIPATVQTVEREKQFAASFQQTVVRQTAPGRGRKEEAAAAPSCAAATQGPLQRAFIKLQDRN